ncbi:MAG: PilZ domain-containing protein [Candidatus Omnitrophica bacterium]|nr:PilZ domain-containing protein [Candidatus Omnitrophota bacterium]
MDDDHVRKHKRVHTEFTMSCAMGPNLEIVVPMTALDISESGLRMLTSREPITGTQVMIIVEVPIYKKCITTMAEVKWSRPSTDRKGYYESGLIFMILSDDMRDLIRDYVFFHS